MRRFALGTVKTGVGLSGGQGFSGPGLKLLLFSGRTCSCDSVRFRHTSDGRWWRTRGRYEGRATAWRGGGGTGMPVTESSLPALLRVWAELQPNSTAYTFIEQAHDPAGFAEHLTWSQAYRRAQAVSDELRLCAAAGDRAAILIPQGLDYIAAFLRALLARFIAVPLSVPQFGIHDERVSSARRYCQPIGLLTASNAVGDVTKYAQSGSCQPGPFVIEVDLLNLDSPRDFGPAVDRHFGPACLHYTSGSTRTPASGIVSRMNVVSNVEQTFLQDIGRFDYLQIVTEATTIPMTSKRPSRRSHGTGARRYRSPRITRNSLSSWSSYRHAWT